MTEELESSQLGTQKYWDECYKLEIENFKYSGDVGDIWFGEDIVDRIIKWIKKSDIQKSDRILDVGCGNGMLLIDLYKEEYHNLEGIDYSRGAITLAKAVAEKEEVKIEFSVGDILKNDLSTNEYNVILDKGTYDAISLSEDSKTNRNKYIENIHTCLKNNGLLIITSCNWTKEELETHFNKHFTTYSLIPTPQFKFGGKIGNVVTCLVFKKNENI